MAGSPTTAEVDRLHEAVLRDLGKPSRWSAWPGGWPGDIESALVDAVFSARAVYRTAHGKGVHAQVTNWQTKRRRSTFTICALEKEIAAGNPDSWARTRFGNSQHSPRRPATAPKGPTKAAAVLEACGALKAIGVDSANDLDDKGPEAKSALRSVPGIGYATANYFLMLLGKPGVKPDRMIHRFVERAVGRSFSDKDAEAIIAAVATRLRVPPHELDHAIWKRESDAARK